MTTPTAPVPPPGAGEVPPPPSLDTIRVTIFDNEGNFTPEARHIAGTLSLLGVDVPPEVMREHLANEGAREAREKAAAVESKPDEAADEEPAPPPEPAHSPDDSDDPEPEPTPTPITRGRSPGYVSARERRATPIRRTTLTGDDVARVAAAVEIPEFIWRDPNIVREAMSINAPLPPRGYSLDEVWPERPSIEDLPPSYWDRYIDFAALPEDVTVAQMRQHARSLYENNRGARDRRLDAFVTQEAQQAQTGGRIGGIIGAKINLALERQFENGYEHQEAMMINEMQKLVKETAGTGPDENLRLVFSKRNDQGVWVRYDGKPLTTQEVRIRKHLLREMRLNPPLYQAKAAYEITKLEANEQPRLWEMIAQIQWSELHYTPEQIRLVLLGIQYMNKPLFLSFKHHGLEHPVKTDDHGRPVQKRDPRDGGPMLENGQPVYEIDETRVQFGPLNARAYATELAQKFSPYEMRFEPADVHEIERLAIRVANGVDAHFYNRPGRNRDGQFLDDLYVLSKLKEVVDASSMGPSATDPSGEKPEDRIKLMEAGMARGSMYPPRISGSSGESNAIWERVAELVNDAARRYPVLASTSRHSETPELSRAERQPGRIRRIKDLV